MKRKECTSKDTQSVVLTIYNDDFGLVRECRDVNLSGEEEFLVFSDVTERIDTNSLMVEGVHVDEFNYEYDLVEKKKLLEKYIGREVFLRDQQTGEKVKCCLLSVEDYGNCVLQDLESGEIYVDTSFELVLPALPSGLLLKPALIWKIQRCQVEQVNVSYLSEGFSWKANYVAEIKETGLSLTSWAEIDNKSGAGFKDAKIKLIAGDVRRISHFRRSSDPLYVMEEPHSFQEKAFFDYHLYTLNNPTTLKNNQKKQIQLFNGSDIAYSKYYVVGPGSEKPEVMIEFENTVDNGLGVPFPEGIFRMYQQDESDGSLEFIGEDSIAHSPVDKLIRLNLGKAFDVECRHRELSRYKQKGIVTVKKSYEIKNHKNKEIQVRVKHRMEEDYWEMVSASHPYDEKSSERIEFLLSVPEKSNLTVEFEYEMDTTLHFRKD